MYPGAAEAGGLLAEKEEMAFEGLAQGRKGMCVCKPDAVRVGLTWYDFVEKRLLKSRESVLQRNGGGGVKG